MHRPEADTSSRPRPAARTIAVIGGGIAGLTAAYRLLGLGYRVTVLEAKPHAGGRAFTDDLDGYRIDTGAQLVGSMYERLLALIDELGLSDRLHRGPGRDALWRYGRAHEVVLGSVTSMIASGGLPISTKMRMGATYAPFLAKNQRAFDLHFPERAAAAGYDVESIAAWGEREIDRSFLRSLVYPQLAAYYGALPEETSAGFYHILARYGMDVKLFAMTRGIGEVADRLVERIREGGGELLCGEEVVGIELADVGQGVRVATASGSTMTFDGVVPAIPATTLARILADAPARLTDWLASVRYRPTLSVALLLDSPSPVRYFGLAFPEGENRQLSTICIQENKCPALVPDGKGLMLLLPLAEATPDLIAMESRDVLDRLLPEAVRVFPDLAQRIVRARVYRWREGAPVFYPGYLHQLARFREDDIEGTLPLAIAGDFLHTPSVEGSTISGERAADRLHRRLAIEG